MADKTSIEWSDATWNIITGCTRVSRGCGGPDGGGCYAERLAATRLRNHPSRAGLTDANGRWSGQVRSLRNQCICAEVPFFFKQWGGATSKSGGAVLDGRAWRQFPGVA